MARLDRLLWPPATALVAGGCADGCHGTVVARALEGGEALVGCAMPEVVRVGGCSGVLVHSRAVLTAAHCIVGRTVPATITVGAVAASRGRAVVVSRCLPYPGYDSTGAYDDIAICLLAESVPVHIPPLVIDTSTVTKGDAAILCGFGSRSREDSDIGGAERCANSTIASRVEGNVFRAGDATHTSCYGDSGGPVYVHAGAGGRSLLGIAVGAEYNPCKEPGTFVSIAPFVSWIESVAGPLWESGTKRLHSAETVTWTPWCTFDGGAETVTWTPWCTFDGGAETTKAAMPMLGDAAAEAGANDASGARDGSAGASEGSARGDQESLPSAQGSSSRRAGDCSVASGGGSDGGRVVGAIGALAAAIARWRRGGRRADIARREIARGAKGWTLMMVGQRLAVVVGFAGTMAACGSEEPAAIPPYAVGPSCPYGFPEYLGALSECSSCLDAIDPGFFAANTCTNYWACFCDCDASDTACYRGCESEIDAECANSWAQTLYVAAHNCTMEGFTGYGCKQECVGQTFPVSMSDLTRIEAQLGGAAMFTPTCVMPEAASMDAAGDVNVMTVPSDAATKDATLDQGKSP
jgi:hypothetical protein